MTVNGQHHRSCLESLGEWRPGTLPHGPCRPCYRPCKSPHPLPILPHSPLLPHTFLEVLVQALPLTHLRLERLRLRRCRFQLSLSLIQLPAQALDPVLGLDLVVDGLGVRLDDRLSVGLRLRG